MAVTVESKSYIMGSQNADFELKGLSADEKPTEINGVAVHQNSLFLELDTGKFYYFDGEDWAEMGGGSSNSEPIIDDDDVV